MSLFEICERCDSREHHWNVREASIQIGEVSRRPHLCDQCTVTVMSVMLDILRPTKIRDLQAENAELRGERLADTV